MMYRMPTEGQATKLYGDGMAGGLQEVQRQLIRQQMDRGGIQGFGSGIAPAATPSIVFHMPLTERDYRGVSLQRGSSADYELTEKIGGGGMAVVYRARSLRKAGSPDVAVKILGDSRAFPHARERFEREAQALKFLSADFRAGGHILVCHDDLYTLENDPALYMVLELLRGVTLKQMLREVGRFDPADAIIIVLQVLEALECVHAQDVVHRDLKPDNIFVEETWNVKLFDFGIAQLAWEEEMRNLAGNLTTMGTILGTPEYMSPEQIQGEKTDARSDLYAVGIVLYEMLAGRPPFGSPEEDTGRRLAAFMRMHMEMNPAPLTTCSDRVSNELEAVVHKLLAKDREQRHPSATDVKNALLKLQKADKLQIPLIDIEE